MWRGGGRRESELQILIQIGLKGKRSGREEEEEEEEKSNIYVARVRL